MGSRKKSDYYVTACHVLNPDTVVVQGEKFVRERICETAWEYQEMESCECVELMLMTCGHVVSDWRSAKYCPYCGARVVS